ncbi:MAG: UvrD-helicase domain-containing protein [Pseudomonadota bacterium]
MSTVSSNITASVSQLIEETVLAQTRASRPDQSAWVSANAGSGKTHVLKMRVQRLLLEGVDPSRILCLTFTKAAAAVMSQRVFADLADWAILDDDALHNRLLALTGRAPNADDLANARRLFANAIETPGGLKVQTIHAFCQDILQRFPLEAGLTPGFETIDDITKAQLMQAAIDGMLIAATDGSRADLSRALGKTIAYAVDDQFAEVLDQVLRRRAWLDLMTSLAAAMPDQKAIELYYRAAFHIDAHATEETLTDDIARLLGANVLTDTASLLDGGSKADVGRADQLRAIAKAESAQAKADLIISFLLTSGDRQPRKTFMTKKIATEYPSQNEQLHEAARRAADLASKRDALATISATQALATLTTDVAQRYRDAKADAARLDFDDLIHETSALLATPDQAQWVLYKLDGGIDHILLDEAQDTSRLQWSIARQLAGEFFSQDDDRALPRSVFAVGDEKQSIYSFQGAEPALFAAAGSWFSGQAAASGRSFASVPLTLSFRTVAPVLEAVDAVFADPARTPGLTQDARAIAHKVKRAGDGGHVEVWSVPEYQPPGDVSPFQPLDDESGRRRFSRIRMSLGRTGRPRAAI